MRIAVIGGGISGLSAAFFLARDLPEADVVLYEQSGVLGGKLRTGELAGRQIDVGAEAMLARRPEGLELLDAVGLAPARVRPLTTSAQLWAGGRRHVIPTGMVTGVPGDIEAVRAASVLSGPGLAQLGVEADAGAPPLTHDVSVGNLVEARMGREVVDRLVEPMLGGVYAGRADELSLRATMPGLAAELARAGGSLLRAAHAVSTAPRPSSDEPVFTSVRGGLGRLPAALVAAGSFTVRTETAVRSVQRTATGFRLALGPRPQEELVDAQAVVVAAPAAKAAALLRDLAPDAAGHLERISTASMAIVSLALADPGSDGRALGLPAGSGLLVAAGSGLAVKAVTISSQKWPGAPVGLQFVRASIGRVGEEAVLQREDSELVDLAARELTVLLGAAVHPVDAVVTRWGGGLPQYAVGHVENVARTRAAVGRVPGLAVAGASYDGVGIPACIRTARLAADRVIEHLRQGAN